MSKPKVQVSGEIFYSEERQGDRGKYYRVGVKGESGDGLFFNLSQSPGDIGVWATFEVTEDAYNKATTRQAAPKASAPAQSSYTQNKEKAEERMRRSVALKAAAQAITVMERTKESIEEVSKDVLALAAKFDSWLNTE